MRIIGEGKRVGLIDVGSAIAHVPLKLAISIRLGLSQQLKVSWGSDLVIEIVSHEPTFHPVVNDPAVPSNLRG